MMQDAGYRRPMGAFGLSDTRFEDLAAIPSRRRKIQLARRIDIVVRRRREPR